MIKLVTLYEDANRDITKAAEAEAIISFCNEQINNYKGNNNFIEVNPFFAIVTIIFKGLKITFMERGNKASAQYFPMQKEIMVYNCIIDRKPRLSISYNHSHLFHEIVHYLDITRQFKTTSKSYYDNADKQIADRGMEGYYNLAPEFNAHFFEFFLPKVLDDIRTNKVNVKMTFNEFIGEIKQTDEWDVLNKNLDPKYKRKLLKRLAGLYTALKQDPAKLNSLVNVDINKIASEKEKMPWFAKLVNKLKLI